MRPQRLAVLVLLLGASTLFADPPATQPAIPIADIPVPPARTTVVAPASSFGGKVIVLPFEVLGDAGGREWVGRAVQESLASEIARLGGFSPVSVAAAGPLDTAAALDAASKSKGDIVIFGDCQFAGTDVRFTGQIVNVSSGSALAGLKAEGNFRDLFALEDQLSLEVGRDLRPPPPPVAGAANPDDSMVFAKEVAPLSTADLYETPSDAQRFADQYDHYYYAPIYEPFLLSGGEGYPFEGGYNLFGTGFYPAEYNSVVIISQRGRDHDRYDHHDPIGNQTPPSSPRMIQAPIMPPGPVQTYSGGTMRGH